jgi:hypothetical protein
VHLRSAETARRSAAQVEPGGAAASPGGDNAFHRKLGQFNPGMVWLDADNRIVAVNDVAMQVLGPLVQASMGISPDTLLGSNVLDLHPPRSREKIEFLLRAHPPVGGTLRSPPPLAMMITVPDRLLMIKVSQMQGADGIAGTCMIFYDLTEEATTPPRAAANARDVAGPRLLSRIPVYRRDRIVLVDVKDVGRFDGEGHYTNIVTATDRYLCNLSMSVLETRLDPEHFMRVHRSHIVNLNYIAELVRFEDSLLAVMPPGMGEPIPVSRSKLPQLKACFGLS